MVLLLIVTGRRSSAGVSEIVLLLIDASPGAKTTIARTQGAAWLACADR
jgi:hypothetical protein